MIEMSFQEAITCGGCYVELGLLEVLVDLRVLLYIFVLEFK